MFRLSTPLRVHLTTKPADLRNRFDGLAALASGSLAAYPLSGHLLVAVDVTLVPGPILSTTTGPPLELIGSNRRRIAVAGGFDPQTLRCLIAVVEDRPCSD
jgi:hypothetical protein